MHNSKSNISKQYAFEVEYKIKIMNFKFGLYWRATWLTIFMLKLQQVCIKTIWIKLMNESVLCNRIIGSNIHGSGVYQAFLFADNLYKAFRTYLCSKSWLYYWVTH